MSKESTILQEACQSRSIFQPLRPSEIAVNDDIPDPLIPLSTEVEAEALPEVTTSTDPDGRPTKRRKLSPPPEDVVQSTVSSNPSSAPVSHSPSRLTPHTLPILYHGRNAYVYRSQPPTAAELVGSTDQYGIPSKVYRNPYYSKESDAPERPREYAGLVFHLKGGDGITDLEEWKPDESAPSVRGSPSCALERTGVDGWEYASAPPSVKQVRKWLEEQKSRQDARPVRVKDTSQASLFLS